MVRNGIPWNVAAEIGPEDHFVFTPAERIAAGIIFGQFEGGRFDFANMCWIKEK